MKNNNVRNIILSLSGFGLFMFTRYHFLTPTIPIAIIIAPVFIMRLLRSIEPSRKAVLISFLGFFISLNLGGWGGLFGNLVASLVANSITAIVVAIPFVIDRLSYNKFKGILRTLIFPISMTAMLYLNSLEGLTDGDAYTQVYLIGEMPLLQLASLFGLPGLVFFWSWVASMFNHFWENDFSLKGIGRSFIVYAVFVLSVNLYCFYKNPNLINESPTVKIASVTMLEELSGNDTEVLDALEHQKISDFDIIMTEAEELVKKTVENDAEIVVFNEFALFIEEEDEQTLLDTLSRISNENDVYLSFSYIKFINGAKEANQQILLDKNGNVLLNYQKRFPLGLDFGGEAKYVAKGPEKIQFVDTEYGRIGLNICRDMFSPTYLYQAGKNNVDIMLNPSYESSRGYSHYYEMRGFEYGFSMVRPSKNGFSFVRDPRGNVISSMDYFATSNNGIMYADVPTKGIKTPYAVIGDLFAWIAVVCMILIIAFSRIRRKRELD